MQEALRYILDDFEQNSEQDTFYEYYTIQGEKYFYDLLKTLSDSTNLSADEYIDWGSKQAYVRINLAVVSRVPESGVPEQATVSLIPHIFP